MYELYLRLRCFSVTDPLIRIRSTTRWTNLSFFVPHQLHSSFQLFCSSTSKESFTMTAPAIPFSEPPYILGLPSPYYTPSHLAWQKACRAFITINLTAHAMDWEREELVPPEVFKKFAAANMLIPTLPAPLPVEWCKRLGLEKLLGGLNVTEFDYIHFLIHADEVWLFPFQLGFFS